MKDIVLVIVVIGFLCLFWSASKGTNKTYASDLTYNEIQRLIRAEEQQAQALKEIATILRKR